ncbi:ABC transporter permease [Desulfopila aestuarii]|uniref:ABC-2 type transport system permease protein n=1 Tax=Desulfopila aestuarii DSM 18488 TaxID=1121416 RepID=A0A1M7Y3I3_9BACT|nr:ABC transporter permease [Desulfopila aestuarii]SHO46764.1 ABC-2 type transport system permease protein [Desulfopila aestuarii DSM 18488]
MGRSFFSIVLREVRELAHDRWLFSLVSWIPLALFFVMFQMFSQQIPRELPLGVIDLDKSTLSRGLIRHYQVSPALEVDDHFFDMSQGAEALRNGDIYALAVIPADLSQDVMLGRPTQVTVFVNDQLLLIGKIINSSLLQAHATFTGQVEAGKNLLGSTQVIELAVSQAAPTASKVTALFNLSVNYAQFLVSAILPAIWQILMIVTTIVSLANSQRLYGGNSWLGEEVVTSLFAKFLPLSILFSLQGALFFSAMYVWQGWPMHGNWLLIFFAQLLTAWASIAAGSLFFFATRGKVETSLSLAASYAAPALAFMGVTFPVTDMTLPARIWRSFLPITHYVEVQFAQVNYGAAVESAVPQLLSLTVFAIPMILAFVLAQRSCRFVNGGAGE